MSVLSKIYDISRVGLCRKESAVAVLAVSAWWLYKNSQRKHEKKDAIDLTIEFRNEKFDKSDKAVVDAVFFRRILRILKIIIPGWLSPEAGYMFLVAAALIARTYCDVWMITNGTSIESSIIGRDNELFKKYLWNFIYAMPAISFVNNVLKFGLNELKLRFRTRLTKHLYSKYLQGFTYYKMNNLDSRISNADQLLTQDIDKFCTSVADLYSNLSKPLLDTAIYAVKLTRGVGAQAPGFMVLYLIVSGVFLTRLRKPIGPMTVLEQKYEGEFRFVNSRLITNSEEVAFYQGNRREKHIILSTFNKLVKHLRNFIYFRFSMGYIDNVIAKYFATVVGYLVVSRPFLNLAYVRFLDSSQNELLEDYYQSGRMLLRMAQALGRIALAGREMARLSGFTTRVTQLMKVLDDLNSGKYERTMVSEQSRLTDKVGETGDVSEPAGGSSSVSGGSPLTITGPSPSPPQSQPQPGSGQLVICDHLIKFEHVPLVTPNGDILVKDLTLEVKSGLNVLVCGPNGCGKSSLFRVLGELWPLFGGKLTKPPSGQLFYIPQRPYMTLGTLRDQLIYPDNKEDQMRRGISDQQLIEFLDYVQLGYILEREGGWDSVQDWMDVLSGGEKQRIAMARVFYHRPQFAILDECTSAVSMDVEDSMYQHCRAMGITLFTVSHRKSLWKHHEYYLYMDGRGDYQYKEISDDTTQFGS